VGNAKGATRRRTKYPYRLDKHVDTLFRISHSATFNVSIQALVLMQQISTNRPVSPLGEFLNQATITDRLQAIQPRYYRALYATLLDFRLASSSKQAMFLNLLFKSLKADQDLIRVKAFVKRFLQVLSSGGCGGEPSFICGGLFLLGEVCPIDLKIGHFSVRTVIHHHTRLTRCCIPIRTIPWWCSERV